MLFTAKLLIKQNCRTAEAEKFQRSYAAKVLEEDKVDASKGEKLMTQTRRCVVFK